MLFYTIENTQDRLLAERLYAKYKALMYSCAEKILSDNQLSEDAVHQSFIKIINNLHKIDESNDNRMRNFLVVICENVAKDIYRKRLYLNNKIFSNGIVLFQSKRYKDSKKIRSNAFLGLNGFSNICNFKRYCASIR